jgi:type IX secretion system PorP/SprF family membrane protein
MNKHFSCLIWLYNFLFFCQLAAQDSQLSQPYNAPLYINPALAGSADGGRVVVGYRNQWVNLPGSFVTYVFSADYNIKEYRSGVGLSVMSDRAGTSALRSNSVSGLYSFMIPLKNDWQARAGLELSYVNRNLNFFELTFNDQIENGIFTGSASADPTANGLSKSYADVATGFMLYNPYVWFGISAHHLTRPNQNFYYRNQSHLPIKYSLQIGLKIPLSPEERTGDGDSYLIPSLMYRSQGGSNQIDLSLQLLHRPVFFGVGYRGLPFQESAKGYFNQDAVFFAAGYRQDTFRFGYSYDFTISKLSGTGGSHEVGLMIFIGQETNKRRKPFLHFPAY